MMERDYTPTYNTPEDCVQYARDFEEPPYPCIRVILNHGTFIDLFDYDFSSDIPKQAEMSALFERAFEGNYAFTDADKELLLSYLMPYLSAEWEKGISRQYEGRFTTIHEEFYEDDEADEYFEDDDFEDEQDASTIDNDPIAVLLTQSYTGDHHEVNNSIFNWYLDFLNEDTDFYNRVLEYRKADSLNPQIADVVVSLPSDF